MVPRSDGDWGISGIPSTPRGVKDLLHVGGDAAPRPCEDASAEQQYELGIYTNLQLPEARYHAIRAMSASTIKRCAESVKHAITARDSFVQTPAMKLGSAVHAALLEPDRFALEWAAPEPGDGRTSAYKAYMAKFREEHAGKNIIPASDLEKVEGIKSEVMQHPIWERFADPESSVEVSALWKDESTSELCKLRMDHLVTDGGVEVITDVKTEGQSASPRQFKLSCARYGYAIQAAWYVDGWKLVSGCSHPVEFHFLVVETRPPYGVAWYRASERMLERGRSQYRLFKDQYAHALKTGTCPGYPQRVIDIDLPGWDMDEELLEGGLAERVK